MKIELKNVKYSDFASHETHCFEAAVYIDGKRAGNVSNDGRGGCNDYHPHELALTLAEHAKTLPKQKWNLDGKKFEIETTLDHIIDELLIDYLHAKDLKRSLSKRILFVGTDGQLKETIGLDKTKMEAALASPTITEKLKAQKILNLLPFDEALSLYINHAKGENHA